ncbi:MAG TPA: BREX-1 system adenine-specific DNA-methyltransferase PglX [Lutibacter sp.]
MNTKTFAQQSRNLLMDGVAKKLLYWGFNTGGAVLESPQKVSGGYSFRGEPFDDPNVPKLWESLKKAVQNKGVDVVVEEAAYTWFNRIMALRIMVKNGYEQAQLENAEGLDHTPILLQKARQGQYAFLSKTEQIRLKKIIGDYSKDQEAFALLLVGYCHSNKLLNTIFGKIDDYTELLLPDNMLQHSGFLHLLNTTDAISDAEYKEVELIGWLYQFYISERKDEVFASFKKNKKAEAKDIPAATQIFTPNWIVKYMVQNTMGKIWLDKNPNSVLKNTMKYLVVNESDNSVSSSAQRIENKPIINEVAELTLIDPASGSGHILVEGFDLLYQMYLEEYYTPEEAVESILKNNLYGLDIDDRAVQLANFAILLKAAKYYRDVLNKGWMPKVYAMPEAANFSAQEIKDFLGADGADYVEELDTALHLMKQAKNLGSVMKLYLSEEGRSFIDKRFEELSKSEYLDLNMEGIFQSIKNYIPVLLILTNKYTAVAANPPYMGQSSMNGELKNYINKHYPVTKSDLMTVFMEVIPNMTLDYSRFALINLPSWLFLSSFETLRKSYIDSYQFDSLLHMGRGIFGIDFGSVAFSMKKEHKVNAIGSYFRLHERNFQHIHFNDIEKLFLYSNGNENYKYDFSQYRGDDGITEIPVKGTVKGLKLFYPNIQQINFSKIPGSPIAYWLTDNMLEMFSWKGLGEYALPQTGLQTSDNKRFVRYWSEVDFKDVYFNCESIAESKKSNLKWYPYNKGGTHRWAGDHEFLVNWQNDGKELREFNSYLNSTRTSSIGIGSTEYFFNKGVTIKKVGSGGFGARYLNSGYIFDAGGSVFFSEYSEILVAFLNSKIASYILTVLNPTVNFQVGDIKRIPYHPDLNKRTDIIELEKEIYKLSINDWDSHETSWDFEKAPLLNESTTLKQAFNTWQENISKDFFQLHTNEEELNRIFIDIYGLQEELTPEVALKDITILQEELSKKDLEKLETVFRKKGATAMQLPINKAEVISQFISYAIGLFMGRYRLDKPGLNIAHPNPTAEELSNYTYNHGKVTIDEDAIIPLMGLNCNFPDDALQQINQLLDTIWGANTRTDNVNFIQECLNKDLEKFLVTDLYKYHCDMYKKKPIYWLFASPKGAFQVLVYMHRMNAFTVEKIRANYLLEHLKNLRSEEGLLKANESNLNTQEAKRLDQIRKDITECETYDMELKNVADQQIVFDLDDGVTENYKLFETVVAKIK